MAGSMAIIAAAIVAYFNAGQDTASAAAGDPIVGGLLAADGNEPRDLYRQVRTEGRDAPWADAHEGVLRDRYAAVAGVPVDSIRATCAKTLCEVAGVIATSPSGDIGDRLLRLQQLDLHGLGDLGLLFGSFALGGSDKAGRATFVSYSKRGPSAPVVVTTTPMQGAIIRPGPFTLTVGFDQPMRPRSFSFVSVDPASYPTCDGRPTQSADGRRFSMRCTAQKGRHYRIGFNTAPYRNFVSVGGIAADAAVLDFSTP